MRTITTFSTEHTPVAGRPGYFRRQMEQLFSIGLDLAPSADHPLKTEVTAYSHRRLQFAALRFSPHVTTRARTRAGSAQLLVTVNKEGPTFVAQDGRESWVGENEIFVVDPARAFYIESGHILTYSVYLPATAVRSAVPHVDALTARVIDGRRGSGAVFRAVVDELCVQRDILSDGEADDIADMLPQALAPALASLDEAARPGASRLRLLHRHRIKRFVREHLGDPSLDVEVIAANVELSPRYVHELFSEEAQPLMRWIWSERLEGCRRELGQGAAAGRPIGEIAYTWGFSNLAHFSRAFSARYGASPSAFRKQSLAEASGGEG